MKKIISSLVASSMLLTLAACGSEDAQGNYEDGTHTGYADGFGGKMTVSVSVSNGNISSVEVLENGETNGIGTPAIEQLPELIVKANNTKVDIVAGATVSSNAIINAVNNALDSTTYPYLVEEKEVASQVASDLYRGVGTSTMGGGLNGYADKEGQTYYYLNHVFANTLFDDNGTILALTLDQLEVSTPNITNTTSPHFYGFPGQSYNVDLDHDGEVDENLTVDEDLFLESFLDMQTKRERGSAYSTNAGSWAKQMDAFADEFIGLNIEEVVSWYEKYCSDINGRALKITDSSDDADVAKFDALTSDEQDYIVDFVATASISLNDDHGNILEAIVNSFENRAGVETTKVASHGSGVSVVGRVGPGTDDNGVTVYSFNEVFAYTLFDEDGRIIDVVVDQYEIKSPNYSSDTNLFIGWPGESYSNGVDEDLATEETLADNMSTLITKGELGSSYAMGTGPWVDQMSAYAQEFIGLTVEEVQEWYNKYCSDVNGRILNISETSSDADIEKFETLTTEEKEMVVDVTTRATMSLNDNHGDIIKAIVKSYENKVDIDITIG